MAVINDFLLIKKQKYVKKIEEIKILQSAKMLSFTAIQNKKSFSVFKAKNVFLNYYLSFLVDECTRFEVVHEKLNLT